MAAVQRAGWREEEEQSGRKSLQELVARASVAGARCLRGAWGLMNRLNKKANGAAVRCGGMLWKMTESSVGSPGALQGIMSTGIGSHR